jgi:hypothetical protein
MTLWAGLLAELDVREMAEIGVYRGAYAEAMLDSCPALRRYYLIDPWRHLDDWNKPANKDNTTFEEFFAETMRRTEAHADKRVVLRGRTTEVVDQIPDGSLDLAYVDGDHTLRGITIDLIRMWPKVRPGGYLTGDDFTPSVWQHKQEFEPTLVFPWAVYFAEAVGAPIYALPHNQFLIHKVDAEPTFHDLAGRYPDLTLRYALSKGQPQARPARAAAPSAPAARPMSASAAATARQRLKRLLQR